MVISNVPSKTAPLATDVLGSTKQLLDQSEQLDAQKIALAKTADEKQRAEDAANRTNMNEILAKEKSKMEEEKNRKTRNAVNKTKNNNRTKELAQQTIAQTETVVEDATTSNTATNSSITQSLEDLNIGNEKNVSYRYSVSGLFPLTDAWQNVPNMLQRLGKSYKEYMSEPTEESIHTDCKMFSSLHCNFYKTPPGSWSSATDQEIFDMCRSLVLKKTPFSKSLEADNQRRVLLDLAFTSPEVFDGLWTTSGILQATGETRIWCAANRLYGSHWKLAVPILSTVKKARFAAATGPKTTMTTHGIFVIQKGVGSRTPVDLSAAPKAIKRSFTTFLKITLPSPPSGCVDTDGFGMVAARQALQLLFRHDTKLVLYPFPKELKPQTKVQTAIQGNSGRLTSKVVLSHYCEKVWLSRDEKWKTYLRIQVGHQLPVLSFNEDKLQLAFSNIDCQLSVALIQDAEYGIAGWLYGIYTPTLNAEHYTTVLNAHPKLRHLAVVVNDRVVKCTPNEKPKYKQQVRAAHILVARRHIILARRLCRSIFNKKKKKKGPDGQLINDLPDGKDCTFVPYGGDVTEIAPTEERQVKFRKVRARQSQFLARTTSSVVKGVLELDYPVDIFDPLKPSTSSALSLTLRQVLCAMKSCADKTRPLFKGIDVKWGGDIVAVYDISLTHEAQLFLAHLPVYLETRFADSIWDWFTPDYKLNEMGEFMWCPDTKRVIDSPIVRVSGDESDSSDEDSNYCTLLAGEIEAHYTDEGEYDFETLNGVGDIPPEFQLEIQLDISIVPNYVGLLDTHGDGASFTTNITGATAAAERPPSDDVESVEDGSSKASDAVSPISRLKTPSGSAAVTPGSSTTNTNSSIGGSPSDRLEESHDG